MPRSRWAGSWSFTLAGCDGLWNKEISVILRGRQILQFALLVVLFAFGGACERVDNQAMSRQELARRGIPFTEEVFLQKAVSGDLPTIQLFLSAGMSARTRNSVNGMTAVMNAALEGHSEVIEVLVENGAELNAQNKDGWTALMLAALKGHSEVVHVLLEKGADIRLKNTAGWTALKAASGSQHPEIIEMLRHAGATE